jgi:hypothetical protein
MLHRSGQPDAPPPAPFYWRFLSNSWFVLAVSLGAACGFALLIRLRYGEPARSSYLIYDVPIAAAFTAFLIDRITRWQIVRTGQLLLDLTVLVLAMLRVFLAVPYISGHALFLAYSLLTCRVWVARLLARLVLVQVIYLKFFAWHDITLAGGLMLGILAWGAYNIYGRWGIEG